MNNSPTEKTILCFGDSNTCGQTPDKSRRYRWLERWPGILQQELGTNYRVVEEGLGGRNTDMEFYDGSKPGRNGRKQLAIAYATHRPLDTIVIMLGTGDLKTFHHRSAEDIAQALYTLTSDIDAYNMQHNDATNIIMITPPLINAHAPRFAEFYTGIYDQRSQAESENLATSIKNKLEAIDCQVIDGSAITNTGADGVHITTASHKALAKAVASAIQNQGNI